MHLTRGQAVAGWVVEAEIGAGGVAVVYRVRHPSSGLLRALKVLKVPTESVRLRLLREGQAQGELRHPHIVALDEVLDVGGSPGLLMEWVRGPTLEQLLRATRPALSDVDRIGRELMAAVAHAHAHGVIHRDLKPANILLEAVDGRLVPKVTDFGLARVLSDDAIGALVTHSGVMLGTPAYMAPEQVDDAKRADARADVFSLGALLYELATGQRAFAAASTRGVLNRAARGEFDDPLVLCPALRPGMVECLRGALEPSLADRLPSVEAMLERWLRGAPELAEVSDLAEVAQGLRSGERTEEQPLVSDDATFLFSHDDATDHLVGREALYRTLRARAVPGGLLTLVGPGGVGKTSLARAWVGDGGRFVDAGELHDVTELQLAIAQALGLRDPEPGELLAALEEVDGRWVVDNVEQIEGVGPALVRWARVGRVAWVITSRRPLGVAEEVVVEVPPLGADAAVELLRRRSGGRLTVAEAGEIVARVDPLPLALELAAARTALLSGAELIRRLDADPTEILSDLSRPVARHRSLGALMAWSWEQLTAAERAALGQLVAFRGSFRAQDAEAVLDLPAPIDLLQALVEQAMVAREGDRLRLLHTVRRVAREAADPDAPLRHAEHFARLGDPDDIDPVRVAPEDDQLRAAVETFLARGRPDDAARAGRALAVGALGVARPHAPALLKRVLAAGPASAHVARLCTLLGMLDDHAMAPERALRWLDRAQAAAGEVPHLLLNVFLARGNLLSRRGDPRGADAAYVAALAQGPSPRARVRLLGNRATVRGALGDLDGAIALGEEARDLAELVDDDLAVTCTCNLAMYHAQAGRLEEASALLLQALPALDARGDVRTSGLMRANQAKMLFELGRFDEARSAVLRALDDIDRSGDTRHGVDALWTLARVEHQRGAVGSARSAILDSIEKAHRLGLRRQEARNLELAALLEEALGDENAAAAHRSRARSLSDV